MPTSSTDTESTSLSLVTEDDGLREGEVYLKARDRTNPGVGQHVISKKKWRQRDEWRTNFIREVRASILQHQRACNEFSLSIPHTQNGICSRRMPVRKLISQAVVKQEETVRPLVDPSGDGTDNLFSENMVVEATIDKDMLPASKAEGLCLEDEDDAFTLWLAGPAMASHMEVQIATSQLWPSDAGTVHDTQGLLTYKKARRQPRNVCFKFV